MPSRASGSLTVTAGANVAAPTIGEPVVSGGPLPANVGFGTCLIPPSDTQRCVGIAIDEGYRLFDTAQRYGNELGVGLALRAAFESGKLRREEVYVTTKVWCENMGYDETLRSVAESAARLQDLEGGIDLVLLHWPGQFVSKGDLIERMAKTQPKLRRESWRALEELQRGGQVKQIGVANFGERHLKELLGTAGVKPAVDQFEVHPYNQREGLVRLCQENGIRVEAYSPLGGKGNEGAVTDELLSDPVLKKVAEAHGKTVAEVIIRWHLQRGITPIPKSVNQPRIRENRDVFDFELSAAEMSTIATLDRNKFAIYDAEQMA